MNEILAKIKEIKAIEDAIDKLNPIVNRKDLTLLVVGNNVVLAELGNMGVGAILRERAEMLRIVLDNLKEDLRLLMGYYLETNKGE